MRAVTNIVIAGLGGQGVLTASDIVADVALHAGFDVKKSELHGMSQRGGSIASDVRFGREVFSPMVPAGEADFLVAVELDQVSVNAAVLSPRAVIVEPSQFHAEKLRNKKSLNVALLGALSRHLEFSEEAWIAAIKRRLPEKLVEVNLEAFALGRGGGPALVVEER
jgi:indolepyruvate ferredoxin oxidoreductase beta subunit